MTRPTFADGKKRYMSHPPELFASWQGVAQRDLAIHELHVGTCTAEGTFAAAARRLPYIKRLGITAVEIMPVGSVDQRLEILPLEFRIHWRTFGLKCRMGTVLSLDVILDPGS